MGCVDRIEIPSVCNTTTPTRPTINNCEPFGFSSFYSFIVGAFDSMGGRRVGEGGCNVHYDIMNDIGVNN